MTTHGALRRVTGFSERPAPAVGGSLADQLVRYLAAADISTYFGVPGGAIEPLFNALARAERDGLVRLIPMRSESGAAFAADGYFRATGRVAVCTCTTGPGISNLLTATMGAHADRIPMLVLTPQVTLRKQGRGALQESSSDGHDLTLMLAACTRYSSDVTHPEQLAYKLSRALWAARAAPGGPVHLSIPSDILAGRSDIALSPASLVVPLPHALDTGALDELVRTVLSASLPVFYVGDDAGSGAHALCGVARRLGGRVVSSPAGKRWVGHFDPAYKGVVGFSGHPEAREALAAADVVVTFGATFDELSTNAWTVFPGDVVTYSVDAHAAHAYRLPGVRPVIASTKQVIEAITERAPRTTQRVGAIMRTLRPPPETTQGAPDAPVHPSDLMRWLSMYLPPEVPVYVDAGNSFSWSTRDLRRPNPDTYRVAMGLATMCWAIGAVVGAAVAREGRVLCVCGDGSFLMSALELTVAVEQALPVTYVILNDSSLGMVRHGQRLAGAEPVAHDIAAVRFDALAAACGAHGIRVNTLAELEEVPLSWLASAEGGPCVIDVRIDREALPPMADRVLGLATGIPK